MKTKDQIKNLKKRREMAMYQRKITTCLGTAIEYDQEIGSINRKLEQLYYRLKKEYKAS